MDLSKTIIPKSDQLNFEDVQSQPITAVIKAVREGSKDQPVFIDLTDYDGRPYKPSKSMRRVLIGGWGNNGHAWVGKALTLIGDPSVKFGGVAVGGIKVHAMSDVDGDFSLMLSVSRGKRVEHRVKKLDVKSPEKAQKSNYELLSDFTAKVGEMESEQFEKSYQWLKNKFTGDTENTEKLDVVYQSHKADMQGQ